MALALALAFALGSYHGRTAERRLNLAGKAHPGTALFEANLRRSRGLRRLHPDPESAMRIHKARVIR